MAAKGAARRALDPVSLSVWAVLEGTSPWWLMSATNPDRGEGAEKSPAWVAAVIARSGRNLAVA